MGADGPSACLVGRRAWQGSMGSLGYRFFAPFLSCAACISEYLSPFRFLSHALPCAVVLQENTPLIRHSAAGNYLHLFKLLFMSFV